MPLSWDDDDEEDLTEVEYRKRPSRILVHEEVTVPGAESYAPRPKPAPSQRTAPLSHPQFQPQTPRASNSSPLMKGAPPRDRFAAFLIDTWVGYFIYLGMGQMLALFLKAPSLEVLHENLTRFAIHVGISLIVFFFYYLIMESALGATLGKLFCRLRVLEINGRSPSLGNVFIRNFLRIVDYPFAFLIAVISMESSPLHQRLGDRASGTVVIKKSRPKIPSVNLQNTPLASTLSRIMGEVLDLICSLALVYGILLLIPSKSPFAQIYLLTIAPLAYLSFYIINEVFSGTTPGKALFRRSVVLDHGQPPDGTSSLLRSLFRPLDYFLGYPLIVLSKKKQRLGDMAADTLVIARSSGPRGLWTSLLSVIVVGIILYLGVHHSQSWVRQQVGSNPLAVFKLFIPSIPSVRPPKSLGPTKQAPPKTKITRSKLPASTSDELKLEEFYFATGPEPNQIRRDQRFRPGDLIFLFFKVGGMSTDENVKISVSENLKVENPEGKVVLDKPQIVRVSKELDEKDPFILFANNIQLPKDSSKGSYRVLITVFDQIAKSQFSFEKTFQLQ